MDFLGFVSCVQSDSTYTTSSDTTSSPIDSHGKPSSVPVRDKNHTNRVQYVPGKSNSYQGYVLDKLPEKHKQTTSSASGVSRDDDLSSFGCFPVTFPFCTDSFEVDGLHENGKDHNYDPVPEEPWFEE